MCNHYPEETKRNILAAVKAGVTQGSIMGRLGVPETTIRNWKKKLGYADIQPASEEILKALFFPDPFLV